MSAEAQQRLSEHTTLRLGGPAREWVTATTEAEVIAALETADDVLVLGGGSNLVVADAGFDGRVVEVATTGIVPDTDSDDPSCGGVMVKVAAGESWDDLVALAVQRGWVGIEALSGIPGRVGATPIQNVGAYGQEVAQTIAQVRVWDRRLNGVRTFANADCAFGYRTSRFKADPERHVILEVTFQFTTGSLGAPVAYAELARTLGVEPGTRAPLTDVREAVLALRRGKGMVLDPADHDTWSAGSFFTNPIVEPAQVPDGAPAWPQADGRIKTSAAWLIEQAGFAKGYARDGVALSGKHVLALTNRGGGTTEQLLALAAEIQARVEATYGIRLVNEPVLVGCDL